MLERQAACWNDVNDIRYVTIILEIQVRKQTAPIASVEVINDYRMQKVNCCEPEHRFERWT